MILRNWMERDPVTVTGDTLVSKAIMLVVEKNKRALPVVEEGELRGLVTRKDLQGCATAVARAQDKYETEYFINRLKIKDVMIRNPHTVDVNDTVEYTMLKGQDELIRNYPVMKGDKLVGLVSSLELFEALSQILGAGEVWCGITLEPVAVKSGTISKVSSIVEEAGATLFGVFTMRQADTDKKRIILRLETDNLAKVAKVLQDNGFGIVEVTTAVQECASEDNGALN